jgi:hypothetical protein
MMPSFSHRLRRLILLSALCDVAGHVHAKGPNSDIFGTWRIDGIATEHSGQLSDSMAKMLLDGTVIINAKRFFYNERLCVRPAYRRSREEKSAYFHDGWQASSRLPLPKLLTIVETGCANIYPIDRNHLLFDDQGVFFSAVRIAN